jgi:hypothetical protein
MPLPQEVENAVHDLGMARIAEDRAGMECHIAALRKKLRSWPDARWASKMAAALANFAPDNPTGVRSSQAFQEIGEALEEMRAEEQAPRSHGTAGKSDHIRR